MDYYMFQVNLYAEVLSSCTNSRVLYCNVDSRHLYGTKTTDPFNNEVLSFQHEVSSILNITGLNDSDVACLNIGYNTLKR